MKRLMSSVAAVAAGSRAAAQWRLPVGASCAHVPVPRPAVRHCSSSGAAELDALSVGKLKEFMDAATIDYRDCLEKRELVRRLEEHRRYLPLHLKNQLATLQQQVGSGVHRGNRAEEVYSQRGWTLEEQNTVSLFKGWRIFPQPIFGRDVCTSKWYKIGLWAVLTQSLLYIIRRGVQNARVNPYSMDVTQVPAGTGSGFVWDTDGHVVTNFHVIQRASKCLITFSNNATSEATVIGTEPDKDLAVLKLARKDGFSLSPIMVGSSQLLEVGQSVYAIGNPFGLDQTLTSGLVSGVGRQVKGVTGRVIRDVVQTDAAINPGNSGGPLLDSQGRLIGVNTMIFSPSGASAGVGFAIPSDTVRRVVNQLVRHGRVIRPSLGLMIFDDKISRQLGIEGVLVQSVVPGSGSQDAGLQGTHKHPTTGQLLLGDEIVAVGGVTISTKEDLTAAIETFNVGDLVTLGVKREGVILDKHVRLKHAAAE